MTEKLNCWEFNKCGRDISGNNVSDLGICPASTNTILDGVHSGISAGRACWIVPGTMCKGRVFRDIGEKYRDCEKCDFYYHVVDTEGDDLLLTPDLLVRLDRHREESVVLHTICPYTLEPIAGCPVKDEGSGEQICSYTSEHDMECHDLLKVVYPVKIKRLSLRAPERPFNAPFNEDLLRRPFSHDLFRSW